VPPGKSCPAAVNGPDTGTSDVSGKRLRSTRVAETGSAAAGAGTTGPRAVGAKPTDPGSADATGPDSAEAGSGCSAFRRAGGSGVWSVGV
jgi:hypothetical protein